MKNCLNAVAFIQFPSNHPSTAIFFFWRYAHAPRYIKEKLLKRSHRSVLYYFIDIALSPSGKTLTAPDIPDIIRRYRVDTWR